MTTGRREVNSELLKKATDQPDALRKKGTEKLGVRRLNPGLTDLISGFVLACCRKGSWGGLIVVFGRAPLIAEGEFRKLHPHKTELGASSRRRVSAAKNRLLVIQSRPIMASLSGKRHLLATEALHSRSGGHDKTSKRVIEAENVGRSS